MSDAVASAPAAAVAPARAGRVRWVICFLLFAAVVLSYVDRLALSVLKPTLQALYHWSESGYGGIVFCKQLSQGRRRSAFTA